MHCPVLDSPKVKLHNKVNDADSKELDRHNRQTKVNLEVAELCVVIWGDAEESENIILLYVALALVSILFSVEIKKKKERKTCTCKSVPGNRLKTISLFRVQLSTSFIVWQLVFPTAH